MNKNSDKIGITFYFLSLLIFLLTRYWKCFFKVEQAEHWFIELVIENFSLLFCMNWTIPQIFSNAGPFLLFFDFCTSNVCCEYLFDCNLAFQLLLVKLWQKLTSEPAFIHVRPLIVCKANPRLRIILNIIKVWWV